MYSVKGGLIVDNSENSFFEYEPNSSHSGSRMHENETNRENSMYVCLVITGGANFIVPASEMTEHKTRSKPKN